MMVDENKALHRAPTSGETDVEAGLPRGPKIGFPIFQRAHDGDDKLTSPSPGKRRQKETKIPTYG
jgi:hypothetical protein